MVLFNVINTDLRHPFQTEFESPGSGTPLEKLKQLLTQQKKPCFSEKYKHLQATDWLYLEGVCTRNVQHGSNKGGHQIRGMGK